MSPVEIQNDPLPASDVRDQPVALLLQCGMFTRPPAFEYKKGELHCERLAVARLAQEYGTPLYLYSAAAIRARYRAFGEAFRGTPHTLCYSVKANSNLSVLRLLAKMGAGFDIVSGGELERVRLAQASAVKKTVFSGVGKTSEELLSALRSGILLFNVESEGELELLAESARKLKKIAPVAFRVNPDVSAETHAYISTGRREHKFGVPMDKARALCHRAAADPCLRVAGVSMHIGSQITDVSSFGLAVRRAVDLIRQLMSDGHTIEFLDAGGGLGISYQSSEPIHFPDLLRAYAEALTRPLRDLGDSSPRLLLEPGRSILAQAGALVTRTLYQKQNGDKRFTVVDAAMNDLLRPALYQARHEITPVIARNPGIGDVVSDVVGPVCETGDFLARDAALPQAATGEYLCVLDAGAYGMALSSNYNTRPRAAEVLVEGTRARLIRKRETLKDLLRPEIACL